MSEQSRRLDLFEGILIGIYGNWLISLLDKISFGEWYQPAFVAISLLLLILVFGMRYFQPNLLTRQRVAILCFGHILGNALALLGEATTYKVFFFGVGTLFSIMIYACEVSRALSGMERRSVLRCASCGYIMDTKYILFRGMVTRCPKCRSEDLRRHFFE